MSAVQPGYLFRQSLAEEHRDIWTEIEQLPFVREVGDATLDERSFACFIGEDVLYLDEFARVLASGAIWATTAETRQLFLQHASTVYAVEQALHVTIAPQVGIDVDVVRTREPRPVTAAYTNHMHRAAATGPLEAVAAAVLPCYWVYKHVGDMLAASPPSNELYRTWVETYSSPEFAEAVEAQLQLIDDLAAAASPELVARMHRLFRQSLRYEWMFWDQAYRRLEWPVG